MRVIIHTFALFTLAVAPASAVDLVQPAEIVRQYVTLRTGASASSGTAGRLRVGEAIPLVDAGREWHEVELPNGSSAFAPAPWTIISRDVEPPPALPASRSQDELRIHFLNIGVGTCTLVECPGANAPPMLVDCGSTGREVGDLTAQQAADYIETLLAPHSTEPNVVISHPDQDHFSLVATVLADTEVENVWLGGDRGEYERFGFETWLSNQQSVTVHAEPTLTPGWHNGGAPLGADLSCGDAEVFVLTVNVGGGAQYE